MSLDISAEGSWMNSSGTLVYRATPGCGATSIGQIMHHGSTGAFYDGDVHWGQADIFRWDQEDHQPAIHEAVATDHAIRFFSIRNPYMRCLSAFFDKVFREQANGKRYREGDLGGDYNLYNLTPQDHDANDPHSDIRLFRRFMLMVWDSNKLKAPHDADIHWYPVSYLCRPFVQRGRPFHDIVATERFAEDMARVLGRIGPAHDTDLATLPPMDEVSGGSAALLHAVEDYYDDLTAWIVQQVFWHDFNLFGYDWAPGGGGPSQHRDMDRINAWFFNG